MKSLGSCCSRIGPTSSTLIVASFHSCGISSPLHTRTRMAWKCLRTTGSRVGSSSLSSSTGSESAPGAFQFAIARTAFCVSAYVGSASSDIGSSICDLDPGGGGGAFLRCCTFSTMDGWSVGDLVLSRLPKNLSHRRRMSSLSRSRFPFLSLMAAVPRFSSRPGPPSFSGVYTNPSCRGVGGVSLVPPHTPLSSIVV